jgi:hypothetical protein
MLYDHVSVGGGVIGINTTINLLNKFSKCKFKKKIKLCVIDKNVLNIPGGIAYGKKTSTHGYFNNPLRLSHNELQRYYNNINNFLKLRNYFKNNGSEYDKRKFKRNLNILKTRDKKKIKEIYLPRVAFAYLQENSLANVIKKIIRLKKNIEIDFYQGEVLNLKNYQKNYFKILTKKNLTQFNLINEDLKKSKISFVKKNEYVHSLVCKNITLGLGITPPQRLVDNKKVNDDYIWDFYSEGGTANLIKKLTNKLESKKEVKICFIGSKAGFLESLQEIYSLKNKNKNLKIYCLSKKFESLQPAKISFQKKIKLKYLKKNTKSIDTAEKLYRIIVNELSTSKQNNNQKYLIWTEILSQNILNYFLKKLSKKELTIYQLKYFQKIRSLTRFTFPETIKIKDIMIKKKMIKIIKEKAKRICLNKNSISVTGDKNRYLFDVVVNVTGPCNLIDSSKFLSIYKSLLNFIDRDGRVVVNKNFSLKLRENLFVPGTIAQGFNDQRLTIIKAITQNSNKSSNYIYKKIHKKIY